MRHLADTCIAPRYLKRIPFKGDKHHGVNRVASIIHDIFGVALNLLNMLARQTPNAVLPADVDLVAEFEVSSNIDAS